MEFTFNGKHYDLTQQQVEQAMHGVAPEPGRKHFVVVGDSEYPIKQVFTRILHVSKLDFTTQQARSVLKRIGFDVRER